MSEPFTPIGRCLILDDFFHHRLYLPNSGTWQTTDSTSAVHVQDVFLNLSTLQRPVIIRIPARKIPLAVVQIREIKSDR